MDVVVVLVKTMEVSLIMLVVTITSVSVVRDVMTLVAKLVDMRVDVAGVTVTLRYDRQSAVPFLPGKASPTTAALLLAGDGLNTSHV